MFHYAVWLFQGPTSEMNIRCPLSQSPKGFYRLSRRCGQLGTISQPCRQPLLVITLTVTDSGGRDFFLEPAGVLCTLLEGPLVPHPSAGRPSHSLILPVPRWLLVGAMWLSSNEPPGINRSLNTWEVTGERELRENADRYFWSQGVRDFVSVGSKPMIDCFDCSETDFKGFSKKDVTW